MSEKEKQLFEWWLAACHVTTTKGVSFIRLGMATAADALGYKLQCDDIGDNRYVTMSYGGTVLGTARLIRKAE